MRLGGTKNQFQFAERSFAACNAYNCHRQLYLQSNSKTVRTSVCDNFMLHDWKPAFCNLGSSRRIASHLHPLAYGGGGTAPCPLPPQTLKIKKCINSMRIFRYKCVFLGVICVFLGGILQIFPGACPRTPPTMVVLKLICDVTRL